MKIDQGILDNLRDYHDKVERIRNLRIEVDPGLSITVEAGRQAKQEALHRAYQEADARYKKLAAKKRQEALERVDETRLAAFRPKGGESVMMSYRDALARLDGVTDDGELRATLERAYEVGDDVMAKAILRRAYELHSEHLVTDYFSKYPGARLAWDAFMAAAEEHNAIESGGFPGAPDRPPELRGYRPPASEGVA